MPWTTGPGGILDSTPRRLTAALGALVALMAATAWILVPDQPWRWIRGMLVIPAIWASLAVHRWWVLRGHPSMDAARRGAARNYGDAVLLLCGAIGLQLVAGYAVAIWTVLGGADRPSAAARRALGALAGVTLILIGNQVPKILTPLFMLPPGGAAPQQAARRFLGLVLVLVGLTLTAIFIAAPLDFAVLARRWAARGVLAATLCAVVWMNAVSRDVQGSGS